MSSSSSSNITSTAFGIKVMSFLTSILAGGIEAYAKLTGKSEDKEEDHSWQKPGPDDRMFFIFFYFLFFFSFLASLDIISK